MCQAMPAMPLYAIQSTTDWLSLTQKGESLFAEMHYLDQEECERQRRLARFLPCKGEKERVIPTPVKTRFVTSVVMMSMLLVYRDVVEHCYSKHEKIDLRQRVHSTETWEIIRVMVDTLGPIMNTCVLSQTRNG